MKKDIDKTEKQLDAAHLKKGFTHKVYAWVHPQRGDDYLLTIYHKTPLADKDIKALLHQKGSLVLDDYTQVPISKPQAA